jgi:hypothetical protein
MKIIAEAEDKLAQPDLTKRAGIILEKTSHWIRIMISEGLVTVERYSQTGNKAGFQCLLTPKRIKEKYRLLIHFLSRKIREYEIFGKKNVGLDRLVMQCSGEAPK